MLPRVWEDPLFDFGAEIKTMIEAKLPFSPVTLAQEPGVLDFTTREHLHQLGLSLEAWKVGSPRFVSEKCTFGRVLPAVPTQRLG